MYMYYIRQTAEIFTTFYRHIRISSLPILYTVRVCLGCLSHPSTLSPISFSDDMQIDARPILNLQISNNGSFGLQQIRNRTTPRRFVTNIRARARVCICVIASCFYEVFPLIYKNYIRYYNR